MKPVMWLSLVVSGTLIVGCSSSSTTPGSTGGSAGIGGNSSTSQATSAGGSTQTGSSATGGTSAASTSCSKTCGALEECGSKGLCVAKMVSITASTNYKIDVTAVTQGQYKAWLATNPALPTSTDPPCGWKADPDGTLGENYAIKGGIYDGADADTYPVYMVDWCDSYAYCQAVGKHLCGKIGGGTNAYTDFADATKSQWYNVCSSGGTNKYPYGTTYNATYCDGHDYNTTAPGTVVAGSLSHCQSSTAGFTGVYDLSGNVREWEDSCSSGTDANGVDATCRVRGGDYYSTNTQLACDFADGAQRSNAGYNAVGFRCCSG